MGAQPNLKTEGGLLLRALCSDDEAHLVEYAGDEKIASTTLHIPHPYTASDAKNFIAKSTEAWNSGKEVVYAMVNQDVGHLIGVVGLILDTDHAVGEIGYWVGSPFWGKGHCTDAATEIIRFGFRVLNLVCIHGHAYSPNVGSVKVLQKIGMTFEGRLRSRIMKNGVRYDLDQYSVLCDEFCQ